MKRISVLILIITTLLLGSCNMFRGATVPRRLPESHEDERMNSILDAMKNGDKDALKSMFSKKTLSEATSFDENLNALFDFFQGEVKSVTVKGNSSSFQRHDGIVKSWTNAWYKVETDQHNYLFIFVDYEKDEELEDNIGLYMLRVILEEEKDELFKSWEEIEIPGIFCSSLE